jgi:hypothetical protein
MERNYWKEEEELILKRWADHALCYEWLHLKCRQIFKRRNTWFSIPVIIISTICGTANFAQDRFDEEHKEMVVVSIGCLSLIAGIITTIYNFLQVSELNEGHRVATMSWGKYHNNLKTELSKHPLDRADPKLALKMYKEEYERLLEISPEILKKIIKLFKSKFKKNDLILKPDIVNKLKGTKIYTMSEEEREYMIKNMDNTIEEQTVFDIDDDPSVTIV